LVSSKRHVQLDCGRPSGSDSMPQLLVTLILINSSDLRAVIEYELTAILFLVFEETSWKTANWVY
jgi:hypothetical protein